VSLLLEKFGRKESLKSTAGRDIRLLAALAHVAILLNTVTYAGGLALSLALYLVARGREQAAYLAEQAGRSLIYQCIVWGIIAAGWMFYRLLPDWLGNVLFWPLWALVWFIAILRAMWKAARCL
jgi:hypothetical protein